MGKLLLCICIIFLFGCMGTPKIDPLATEKAQIERGILPHGMFLDELDRHKVFARGMDAPFLYRRLKERLSNLQFMIEKSRAYEKKDNFFKTSDMAEALAYEQVLRSHADFDLYSMYFYVSYLSEACMAMRHHTLSGEANTQRLLSMYGYNQNASVYWCQIAMEKAQQLVSKAEKAGRSKTKMDSHIAVLNPSERDVTGTSMIQLAQLYEKVDLFESNELAATWYLRAANNALDEGMLSRYARKYYLVAMELDPGNALGALVRAKLERAPY